jgi:glycosyltransferase involved in cell wall biosynthesis
MNGERYGAIAKRHAPRHMKISMHVSKTSSPQQSLLLSGHPLSEKFRKHIEASLLQPLVHLPLSGLRMKGPLSALSHLRRLSADCVYIAVEEPDEAIFLPVLCLASLPIRARQTFIIGEDGRATRIGPNRIAAALARVVTGTLKGIGAGVQAWIELRALAKAARTTARTPVNARILYLNTNVMFGVRAGGSLGHIAGVVNEIHRRKMGIVYVATRPSAVLDPEVPTTRLAIPHVLGFPNELFSFGMSQAAYRQLRECVEREVPQVIYQRMSRCNYTGAMLSKRHNVPLVLEYNGSEALSARLWGRRMVFESLARQAELVSLTSAQMIVTISDVLADELTALGIDRSRIVVYPNCVDASVFDPARFGPETLTQLRSRHGIAQRAVVLGFIGTFGAWHGINILCDAIRHLAHEHSQWLKRFNVTFLIVGDGALRAHVEALVKDETIAQFVVWPGLVEQAQAPAYLAMMDILVSPHVRNADGTAFFGSPTKLFEYMAMRRPIIASRLGQIETVLTPGLSAHALPAEPPCGDAKQLAILAEPGNMNELVDAMRFLVERSDWRATLATNARQEVLGKYSWTHHVARIIEGMNRLVHTQADEQSAAMAAAS